MGQAVFLRSLRDGLLSHTDLAQIYFSTFPEASERSFQVLRQLRPIASKGLGASCGCSVCRRLRPSVGDAIARASLSESAMKPILCDAVCWMSLLGTLVCGVAEVRAQQLPNPISTNQPNFRIPYKFDPVEIQRLQAREIRLYLSRNEGLDWQQVQRADPNAGRFEFKAPADGTFWFAVRTVDGRGQMHPDNEVTEPGLIVIVDRAAPDLQLLLQEADGGRVTLQWSVADANLDPAKLTLEFSQDGGAWQSVNVRSQAAGQTNWSAAVGTQVSVRGSASDRAGNVGSSQTTLKVQGRGTVPAGEPPRPRNDAADYRQPVADNSRSLPTPAPDPFSASRVQSSASVPSLPNLGPTLNPTNPFPPTDAKPSLPFSASNLSTPNPGLSGSTVQTSGPGKLNATAWGASNGRSPTGGRFRSVRAHRFEINYRVDDVGPSGVSAVELYVTQNNGQKWWKYGDDPDKQSPFAVEVPEDGVYGFAIRVKSGVGLSDEPPQANEEPSIVIVVDRTPPTVQLAPPQQGAGAGMNKINISWRVQDDNPSDRPISLSYAGSPQGPWEPICAWQQDTGNYVWQVNQGVPARLYIRVIARDAAGNTSFVDTPQPLLVDLAKPTARIVDVDASGRQ